MWTQIQDTISHAINRPFVIEDKHQLSTSHNINLYKVHDEHSVFFIKLADKPYAEQFDAEAFCIQELIQESLFFVPDSIVTGTTMSHAFHVIEWIDLEDDCCATWYKMGETLAKMHKKHEQAMFGFEQDNFIGATAQPNQWHKKWDVFFSEQRIGWQLQLLKEKGIKVCDIEPFIALVKELLHHHHIKPSLLHGDLWRGNVSFYKNQPVVYDPACYFGDREVDVAMTELFGKFHHDFYQGYQNTYPIAQGYESRKPIYNLYHILNHANLFGGNYIDDAHNQITKIIQDNW